MSQRTGYQPADPYHVARASLADPLPTHDWFDDFHAAIRRRDYVTARELVLVNEGEGTAARMLGEMIARELEVK